MRPGRTVVGLATAVGGAALLVWYVRYIGLDSIRAGLAPVGPWFVLILVLSLLRFVARAAAWASLNAQPVPVGHALAATISGDAIGQVTPFGVFAGEPAKALLLRREVAAPGALAALTAENFFYGVSIAVYVMVGAAAMLVAFPLPDAVRLAGAAALLAMAAGLAFAGWLAWRRPSIVGAALSALPFSRLRAAAARVRDFEAQTYGSAAAPGTRLGVVAGYEAAFHILSFVEAWLTLWLLTGRSLPLEAFVLDAFGRVVNVIFKVVPLRLGVDQAGSGVLAQAIGLDPVTGVALSLVRTTRLVVWSVVGLALLARRGRR